MIILKAKIFLNYPEIVFGFNTKVDDDSSAPFFFNLSYSVNDDIEKVEANRRKYFAELGISGEMIVFQSQTHSDIVTIAEKAGTVGESDAIITAKIGLGIAISAADCNPIFVYDPVNRIIAGIHSGWKGTELRITSKTVRKMKEVFNSKPENMVAYLAPSISGLNYQVGTDVADLFSQKYVSKRGKELFLDLKQANYDMLIYEGLIGKNIQKSDLCTYSEKSLLHSYRRDGQNSGRSLGIIAVKGIGQE